jgi:DnaJ family protein A protein 5
VRAGDEALNDPKSKFNKRRAGDPGVKLDHIMRFFDPKLARKMDDTNEVGVESGRASWRWNVS